MEYKAKSFNSTVHAIRYDGTGEGFESADDFCDGHLYVHGAQVYLEASPEDLKVQFGDYLVNDGTKILPIKPRIFESTYAPVK